MTREMQGVSFGKPATSRSQDGSDVIDRVTAEMGCL